MYVYESTHDDKTFCLLMGKDKYENDLMIKLFYKEMNAVWFHVNNYSSSHVYMLLKSPIKSDVKLSDLVSHQHINDAMQLCKSNSVAGNKLQQVEIVSTPFTNLKKSGDMDPGQVSFKSTRFLSYFTCYARDNTVLNRLEKSKLVLDADLTSTEDIMNLADSMDKDAIDYVEISANISAEDKVLPNLEEFLRKCKKSKDGQRIEMYVKTHSLRLKLMERLRRKLKKVNKSGKNKIIGGIDYSDFSYV
ncbi:Protein JLP2 [Hanseniaspora uvarum]|uniref:Protein JLP2 n=1 Tax=Hanseniaspora uvarum TaxID=29833 RepID=A0A1E5RPJ4_HANUV|nr:Protein JLP2 [Hanseniaspora uvarum]